MTSICPSLAYWSENSTQSQHESFSLLFLVSGVGFKLSSPSVTMVSFRIEFILSTCHNLVSANLGVCTLGAGCTFLDDDDMLPVLDVGVSNGPSFPC